MPTQIEMPQIDVQLAEIKECLKYIQRDINTMIKKQEDMDNRVTTVENKATGLETKVGMFAGIQGAFSIAVGLIAAWMGGNK